MRAPLTLITTGLMLLALTAVAHADKPKPNALLDDWNTLVNSGCDLDKHRVRTPIEASVLRNTPYAMAGYAFKSKGLRAIFSADGAWYTPRSKAAPKFLPKVGACISKLKALEAQFKASVGALKAVKERVFLDRSTYLDVRGHSKLMAGGASTVRTNLSGGLSVACKTCTQLNYYELICPKSEDCLVVVAGTGDHIPE